MSEHVHSSAPFPYSFSLVLDYLVYSSVYLSLAAAGMAYLSGVLHEVPCNPVVLILGMLTTYSVYNLNRKTDESEDEINHSERYAFTKRYEKTLLATAIGAYVLALVLSGVYGMAVIVIAAIPLLSGLVYSTPLLPPGFRYRRLKEIPVAKSLLVACAWALPPALLPVYIAGAVPGIITIGVILFFFSLVFINTVLFDIRDVVGDRATGVRTIPVCIGIPGTKLLLTGVNISLGLLILGLLAGRIPLIFLVLILAGMIYAQGYILLYHRMKAGNLVCDLIADGQFILLGLCMGCLVVIRGALPALPLG